MYRNSPFRRRARSGPEQSIAAPSFRLSRPTLPSNVRIAPRAARRTWWSSVHWMAASSPGPIGPQNYPSYSESRRQHCDQS